MKKNFMFLVSPVFVTIFFLTPHKIWGIDDSYDLIEKIYDGAVTYGPGIFNSHNDRGTFATQSQFPRLSTQTRSAYNKNNFTSEVELEERPVSSAQDGRQRIQSTTMWPYKIHAHLNMVFDGKDYAASGVMVGPNHLLTCGHNVYNFNKKFFFQEISVYPALNGDAAPFNKAQVTRAYIFKGWQDRGDQQFDMALLLLDQRMGDYVGWGGLLSTTDTDLFQKKVYVTGYPKDKDYKEMWEISHKIKTVKPEELDYEIDGYPAQSGSAVWIDEEDEPMILGVQTLGKNSMNSVVRLSEKKFSEIVKKIEGAYPLLDTYLVRTESIDEMIAVRHILLYSAVPHHLAAADQTRIRCISQLSYMLKEEIKNIRNYPQYPIGVIGEIESDLSALKLKDILPLPDGTSRRCNRFCTLMFLVAPMNATVIMCAALELHPATLFILPHISTLVACSIWYYLGVSRQEQQRQKAIEVLDRHISLVMTQYERVNGCPHPRRDEFLEMD